MVVDRSVAKGDACPAGTAPWIHIVIEDRLSSVLALSWGHREHWGSLDHCPFGDVFSRENTEAFTTGSFEFKWKIHNGQCTLVCMTIQFLGAAGSVTGSCYVLTSTSRQSIMIDCGMFQGSPELEALNYQPIAYDTGKLLGFILTHAHLDHCGRLPMILAGGYNKPIWMTRPTRDIAEISLFDTAKIAKFDRDQTPMYTKDDVESTIKLFQTADYGQQISIGDFRITMRDAGHILGSASLEIEDTSSEAGNSTVVFSGDLGNSPQDLIRPTETILHGDTVVMESTYGDRLHPQENASDKIASEIQVIEKNGGTLLIPAFSIERSQELLHRIAHLKQSGKVRRETLVFFDSPMGEKVTQVFEHYQELFNTELQRDFKVSDPFAFPGLSIMQTPADSEGISAVTEAKVIIAGSGMMSGGRIVGHAIKYLPDPKTRVLIVGYQGKETLGRALLDGQKSVMIQGVSVTVNATISETQAMSSHADQAQLLKWLKSIKGVKQLFLTHGEDEPRKALEAKVRSDVGIPNIGLPTRGAIVTL